MRYEAIKLPRGVSWDKSHRGKKKYKTRVFFNGRDRFIGRFETVSEAERAYEQAMRCFKSSQAPDCPSFLQHVRAIVQQIDGDAHEIGENSPAVTSETPDYITGPVDDVHNESAPLQTTLISQRSLQTSQSNTQSCTSGAGVHGMQYELEAAAVADTLSAPRATMAAAAVTSAAIPTDCINHRNFNALMGNALSDQQVEEAMALDILQALGVVPVGNAPQPNQQQEMMGQQSLPEVGQRQLLGTAMQQGWVHSFAGTSSVVGAAAACAAPVEGVATAQQHEHRAGLHAPAELRQLLHTVLQDATQFDKAIAADLQCDVSMTTCCSEFLAATADPAVAAAHTAQPAQRPGGPKPSTPATMSPETPASEPPAPSFPATTLGRENSLLLKAHHSLDAVLYTAAVMRAVLDLYSALLHKLMEDDAAGDLVHWLATYRHNQHNASAAANGAAPAASKRLGANSSMLGTAVINVMGKVVCALISSPEEAKPNSSLHAAESIDSNNRRAGSLSQELCAPGGTAAAVSHGMTAPLAQRRFTMAVLERLSGHLIKLHRVLQQQQQQCTIVPAVLWQQVHTWLQRLQAQAVTAEDLMAVELAALL